MSSRAPKPKHDAIRRGREIARQEQAAGRFMLIRDFAGGAIFYGPLAALAYRSWKRGQSWLGVAIFSVGSLAVMAWCVVRQLRAVKQRREMRARLEESGRRREEPTDAGSYVRRTR